MTEPTEMHVHLHIHEGTSEEAARAAAEALIAAPTSGDASSSNETASPEIDADTRRSYIVRGYTESGGMARPLLEFLADNPDRRIPFTEVSAGLGFDTARSLPGLLGSFGKRANHRYEGVKPFEAIWEGDHALLVMSQENADIINGLR